jgi:hypothetical protein
MGCPKVYYTRALQCFAHCLTYEDDSKLAKALLEEQSDSKLETAILQNKKTLSEKEFFYNAGRVAQLVSDEAEAEGVDPMNASICGVAKFNDFIGLK